jgi:putative Holliday junction resolvase
LGQKRTGIAVTDPLGLVPGSLDTLETLEVLTFLKKYCVSEQVSSMVVGLPIHLNGEESEMTVFVKNFIIELQREFPDIEINTIDERLSSVQAQKTLIQMGIKKSKRQDKGIYDKMSAMILLQSYMDKIVQK